MTNQFNDFWKWFQSIEGDLREDITQPPDSLMDDIVEQLHLIDDGLYFEVGFDTNDGLFDLVITAECRLDKFELVKRFCLSAPQIKEWKVTALKPAFGKGFKVRYEGIDIDPADIPFVLMQKGDTDTFGLQVIYPGFQDLGDNLLNGLYIACDNILGEERSTRFIAKIWCVDSFEGDPTDILDNVGAYLPCSEP